MKKIFIILSVVLAVLLIGSIAFALNSNNSSINTEKIKESLIKKGAKVIDVSADNKDLKIKIKSDGIDKITKDDVLSIREFKNEARKAENKNLVKNLSQIIEDKNGKIISNGTINDINTIPNLGEVQPINRLNIKDTEQELFKVLSEYNIKIDRIKISDSELGGKLATISVVINDSDISNANQLVQRGIIPFTIRKVWL